MVGVKQGPNREHWSRDHTPALHHAVVQPRQPARRSRAPDLAPRALVRGQPLFEGRAPITIPPGGLPLADLLQALAGVPPQRVLEHARDRQAPGFVQPTRVVLGEFQVQVFLLSWPTGCS